MQSLLIIYADGNLSDPAVWQEITAGHMRLGAELQEKGAKAGRDAEAAEALGAALALGPAPAERMFLAHRLGRLTY
jgi:hypothetical protein